jgi:cytochrome c
MTTTHSPRIRTAFRAALFIAASALLAHADDIAKGQQIFEHQCSKCHALDANKEGPRLRGVYGRAAATVPSFEYSDALKKSHITWSDDSLNTWLTNPSAFVPETYMAFKLSDAGARKAVIAYLSQLSAK